MTDAFDSGFHSAPVIAILRGLQADEAEPALRALAAGGVTLAEVPLNRPGALDALEAGAKVDGIVAGAGTVMTAEAVRQAAEVGARYVVAPNFNPEVVSAAVELAIAAVPGIATPTEAFAALGAGAHALKLFPAEVIGPGGLAAIREVLPTDCRIIPVGGVAAANIASWRAAGASGIGVGSSLFKPGVTAKQLEARARQLIAAWIDGQPENEKTDGQR